MVDTTAQPRHTNRLIGETSPYLLQHAHNPVDWYPWGDEALKRAKAEDRLILLSIGYSACHWCHVMERESFEDEAIAALMNEHYVNIKVDREERPDLDDIYMAATVAMNRGQGGWPMTVFLTPDCEPVFAGTYFPPDNRPGAPGFPTLLVEIARAWREDRGQLRQRAAEFVGVLRQQRALGPAIAVGEDELRRALADYAQDFDPLYGGFGSAPKFPPATGLMLLLRLHLRFKDLHALAMVRKTLDGMARGGMYDQVGGGFCRYATDHRWLVPHFEKMLYDNALLARAYLEAYQLTNDGSYRRIAAEVLDYVLREMTAPEGGFYSSTDADSEGVEGKFFVWTPAEVREVLGDADADLFNAYYDVTEDGNWEGKSIPNIPRSVEDVARQFELSPEEAHSRLQTARAEMYAYRATREKPGLDDKILTSWNGLMIGAMAEGYRVLGDRRYLDAARRSADFLLTTLVDADGRLLRTYRAGTAHLNAYLEDYAYFSEALVDLYEAGGDVRFLREATQLVEEMIRGFADRDDGAFYNTSLGHETLIMRYREGSDGATPSSNAAAASVCARLGIHLGRPDLQYAAMNAIKAHGEMISRFPRGFAKSLIVVDFLLEGPVELVLAGRRDGDDTDAFRRALADHFIPNRVQALYDPTVGEDTEGLPLLQGKDLISGRAALYICREYACEAPITDVEQVAAALAVERHSGSLSIAVRRPGAASPEGTAGYAARFGSIIGAPAAGTASDDAVPFGFQLLGATELVTSRLGFGGYRTDDVTLQHKEGLVRALMSGVNLVDTSSNYMDGGSERLVGTVLAELMGEGDLRRDEVIVVSKIGYVQGTNLELARGREERGAPFPEMTKVNDELWHCIHPEFLGDQLSRSLDRLELETLDVCLLHNPEYFLSNAEAEGRQREAAREEFYRRLTEAFRFLETQVEAGHLRWYGVSSNTLVSPPGDADATSISRILDAAEAAHGVNHRCRVVQVPINLVETGAVFERNTGPEHDRTLLEVARERNIAVLANRPLNAIVHGSMLRLADVVTTDQEVDFDEQCERVAALEKAFGERLAPAIVVPEGAMDPTRYFDWAPQLASLRDEAMSLEQWSGVATQLQFRVGRISKILDHALRGDTAARWTTWRDTYTPELGRLLGELRRQAAERAANQTVAISGRIDPLLPEERRTESLSRKAIWIVASTPGVSAVLNGMRTPEYVRDSLGVLEWPVLSDAVTVLRAVAAGEP